MPWPKGRSFSAEHRKRIGDAGRVPGHGWPKGRSMTLSHRLKIGRPVGSERVHHGRVEIKCADGKWQRRSHVVWEKEHGPIPPGHMIHHHNEIKKDDRLSNLRCMTYAEHSREHRRRDGRSFGGNRWAKVRALTGGTAT